MRNPIQIMTNCAHMALAAIEELAPDGSSYDVIGCGDDDEPSCFFYVTNDPKKAKRMAALCEELQAEAGDQTVTASMDTETGSVTKPIIAKAGGQ